MENDRFGLVLSTTSPAAAESYCTFVDYLISSRNGAKEYLGAALEADDGFAVARIGGAFLQFVEGQADEAKRSAAEAVRLGAGATARERSHIEAFASRINGEAVRSSELFRQHLAEYPRDVLAVFISQGAVAFSGWRHWKEEIGRLTDAVAPHYDADEWAILGLRAFRAEEERRNDEARLLAQESLARYPANARAAHVLAHTYFESAQHPDGRRFLLEWIPTHDPAADFGAHLWWHVALHQLGLHDHQGAVETLRTGIASGGRNPFGVADPASLLWRMDLYGFAADQDDWRRVSDLATEVVSGPGFGFVDAHVILAHAGAHDHERFGAFVGQLEVQAEQGSDLAGAVLLPLARGIAAFSEGRPVQATDHLADLIGSGEIVRIGGSNAQREVFEDTLIAAMVAAGERSAARALIDARLVRRGSWVDEQWRVAVGA